jgi:arylsulfatase A-like enzyme
VHLTPQVNDALAWLDDDSSAPFLLFLHGYDAHLPYAAPAVFSGLFDVSPDLHRSARSCAALVDAGAWSCRGDGVDAQTLIDQPEMGAHMEAHYDAAVRHADHQLGRLLHELSVRGHLDNAIIVAMSDHGESLELPDPFQHDWACGEAVFHVPLVIRLPEETPPVRSEDPVSLADVLPSLAGQLGMTAPSGSTGRALFDLDGLSATASSERIVTAASKRCYWARSDDWTLEGTLPSQPQTAISWALRAGEETEDRAAAHPEVFKRMHAAVADWPTQLDLVDLNRRPGRNNKAMEKALRDGGYWSPPGEKQ